MRFFSILVPTITTLKCYVCNENESPSCADESALAKFVSECKETVDPHCRKISQTVNEKTTIVRTCGSKTGSKSCYKTAGKNNVKRLLFFFSIDVFLHSFRLGECLFV